MYTHQLTAELIQQLSSQSIDYKAKLATLKSVQLAPGVELLNIHLDSPTQLGQQDQERDQVRSWLPLIITGAVVAMLGCTILLCVLYRQKGRLETKLQTIELAAKISKYSTVPAEQDSA